MQECSEVYAIKIGHLFLPVKLLCNVGPEAFRVIYRPFVHGIILFLRFQQGVLVVFSNGLCPTLNLNNRLQQTMHKVSTGRCRPKTALWVIKRYSMVLTSVCARHVCPLRLDKALLRTTGNLDLFACTGSPAW